MKYIIIDGTFVDSDGSLKGPGQSIELDKDMALHHQGRVREEQPGDTELPDVQAPALPAAADPA